MKVVNLILFILFIGIHNEAYALCVDGTTASCIIQGVTGTRVCINGRFGPCDPNEEPPPPPPPSPPPPSNYQLSSAATPISTPEQIAEWRRVVNQQLSVAAKDPIGHKIGPNVAKRRFVGMNWYPMDIYKHVSVGTLHHFNFYDAWTSGDEADWNNFILPSDTFKYLIDDVLPLKELAYRCIKMGRFGCEKYESYDVWHFCDSVPCMEAEITPDEHFYENPYFTKSTDRSFLEGRLIGTYGPWVYEEAHGNRPEIHPSEMYWWQESLTSGQVDYFLMLVQDDSNRFDRTDDYTGNITRPWSKFPRTGEFKIAFELNDVSAGPAKFFDIHELYARNVLPRVIDADDGTEHALEYDGKVLLRVNERQNLDENIQVNFVEVTRNEANTRLQGYLALTSSVGKGDRGDEGYHVIQVAESNAGSGGEGMEFNTDRMGLDYKSFDLAQANPALCQSSCGGEAQCKAWTYVKPGIQGANARCWLKSSVPAARPSTCCVSGVNGMEYNMDRLGSDYKNFDLAQADPALCQSRCSGEAQCKAWTYVRPGIQGANARCWLKESVPAAIPNTCCISGQASQPLVATVRPTAPVLLDQNIAVKAQPKTLRYAVIAGKPQLVGDVHIQVLDGAPTFTPATAEVFTRANLSTKLKLQAVPQNMRTTGTVGIVKDIPVFSGGKLNLKNRQSNEINFKTPTLALAPSISESKSLLATENRAAWPNFFKAAGAKASNQTSSVKLTAVKQLQIGIAPVYGVVRDGKLSLEDDSPFSEEINDILKSKDMVRTKKVFNTNQPIKDVRWTFRGRNVTTGRVVTVKAGNPATDAEIKVDFPPSTLKNSAIKVTFPAKPANTIFELMATAEMVDVFGNKGQLTKTVSSHALTSENPAKLAETMITVAASAAAMPSDKDILSASKIDGLPEDDRTVRDPFRRCARMLRLYAMHTSADNMIDMNEFKKLNKTAELCKTR